MIYVILLENIPLDGKMHMAKIIQIFLWLRQKNTNFILNSIAIIQRWSLQRRPRKHILKSLVSASKVKSLASKPTSPRKCPVCGRGQHYFLIWKKWAKVMTFFSSFWRTHQRPRGKFMKTFFLENTCALCPWSLASRGLVLGLGLFCVLGLGLEPRVFDSTSAIISFTFTWMVQD